MRFFQYFTKNEKYFIDLKLYTFNEFKTSFDKERPMVKYHFFFRHKSPSKHFSHAKLEVSCPEVRFSAIRRPLTALASFPGSGNTWARHLIEQSTGRQYKPSVISGQGILLNNPQVGKTNHQ